MYTGGEFPLPAVPYGLHIRRGRWIFQKFRKTDVRERTGTAPGRRPYPRRMTAVGQRAHFRQHPRHPLPEFRRERDDLPAPGFPIEKTGGRDGRTAEHLLKAHCLGTELQPVRIVLLLVAALVLDRGRQPQPLPPGKRNAARVGTEFHHVAFPGHAVALRTHRHSTADQQIAPLFSEVGVIRPLVPQPTIHRQVVVRPLHFNVDQRPLPPAESKMLQA